MDITGQYIIVCASYIGNSNMYTSTNYGNTFSLSTAIVSCTSVSSSSTGKYLFAGTANGANANSQIYISNNYGSSWTVIISPSNNQVWSISTSSTGQVKFI